MCSVNVPARRAANSRWPGRLPGTATPPCPCQALTNASTPRMWRSVSPRAQHPAPHRGRHLGQFGHRQAVCAARKVEYLGGEDVEHLAIGTQRVGGAGQGFGDSTAEDVLEQRQHLGAQPDPGEARVGVVRIRPRGELQLCARRRGDGTAHPQKWPTPGRVVAAHTRDGPRARAAPQAQQDRLGLVVEGVREQYRRPGACLVECRVARRPGRRLRTADGADLHAQDPGRDTAHRQRLGLGGAGHLGRILLQLVIDDQRRGGPQRGGRRGQRQRIRSSGQRHAPPRVARGVLAGEAGHCGPQFG